MSAAMLELEELLEMPDRDHYEVINGVPTEKPMGAKSQRVVARLVSLLDPFCLRTGCGAVFIETGFRTCFPGKPLQLRKPDVSFVAAARLPGGAPPDGDFTIAPDFIAEMVSPHDSYEEVQSRIMDFRSANTRLIWVVSVESKSVLIRRLDGTCTEVFEDGELSGEEVIPGFTCKVAELFV